MKKITVVLLGLIISTGVYAQSVTGQIGLYPLVISENLPEESVNLLKNKLDNIVASNGYGACSYVDRFVLSAKVDVTSNSIIPTNPPRISKKIDVTFVIGDVMENVSFASCVISLQGMGINDNKALISAFSSVSASNPTIQQMLASAFSKISTYYGSNQERFINQASAMAMKGNYDEAISYLMSIPPIDDNCYQACQESAIAVYKSKVNNTSSLFYLSAKETWTSNKTNEGARIALSYLKQVDPASDCYPDALALWGAISDKLDVNEQEEKEMAMIKYNDKQKFRTGILDACKAIGVAFCEHRPQSVTRIVRGWF